MRYRCLPLDDFILCVYSVNIVSAFETQDFAFRYWFGLFIPNWSVHEKTDEHEKNEILNNCNAQSIEPNQLDETYFDSVIGIVVKIK